MFGPARRHVNASSQAKRKDSVGYFLPLSCFRFLCSCSLCTRCAHASQILFADCFPHSIQTGLRFLLIVLLCAWCPAFADTILAPTRRQVNAVGIQSGLLIFFPKPSNQQPSGTYQRRQGSTEGVPSTCQGNSDTGRLQQSGKQSESAQQKSFL